jgi:hypothetical protein
MGYRDIFVGNVDRFSKKLQSPTSLALAEEYNVHRNVWAVAGQPGSDLRQWLS